MLVGETPGFLLAFGLSRLESFDFHHPGDPIALPPHNRGGIGPLPIATALPEGDLGSEEGPFSEEEVWEDSGW